MPFFFGGTLEISFSSDSDLFTDDLQKGLLTTNPTIIPEIDCVWVLSGRSTVLGHDADGLKREFDYGDDLARVLEGVRVATEVNLLRSGKQKADQLARSEWVTPIFYNGRSIHNQDLKKALAEDLEKNLAERKIPYPAHLVSIEDIDPQTTIGQIGSFKKYFSGQSDRIKNIAVVSSAYHLPRVARTIGKDSPQTGVEKVYAWPSYSMKQKLRTVTVQEDHPIRQFNFFLFGVHKQEARPGIVHDLQGECNAMRDYSSGEQPSIARQVCNNTFLNDADSYSLKTFNRALFWHHMGQSTEAAHPVSFKLRRRFNLPHPSTHQPQPVNIVAVAKLI